MDHAYPNQSLAPNHGGVHTGEMIFHEAIILPPGGLIVDGGGVVPLGFALHGYPAQVRYPDGDAQGSLPVALMLVPPEVKVPAGDTVEFA